jgi:hypothetical protein
VEQVVVVGYLVYQQAQLVYLLLHLGVEMVLYMEEEEEEEEVLIPHQLCVLVVLGVREQQEWL